MRTKKLVGNIVGVTDKSLTDIYYTFCIFLKLDIYRKDVNTDIIASLEGIYISKFIIPGIYNYSNSP